MRKPEWLFVALLLLIGAYFSYRYFSKTEKFDPLKLIPGTAALVYEITDPIQAVTSLESVEYFKDLLKISEVEKAYRTTILFDSLMGAQPNQIKNLISKQSIASIHVTGNESLGIMLYLPTGVGTAQVLEKLLQTRTGKSINKLNREYSNHTIHELSADDIQFTYLNYKNYFIVSSYGYLIEDVVRNINAEFEEGLFSKNDELIKVPKLKNDIGNLYINGHLLTDLLNTSLPSLNPLQTEFARSVFFDLNLSRTKLFMSGFVFTNSESEFVSIFNDQEAAYPASLKLVSENAASVMTINLSDVPVWHERWMTKFGTAKSLPIGQSVVKYFTGDISLVTHYSNDPERPDKILFAKISDIEGTLNMLNLKAEELAIEASDTVYFESFADYSIGLIDKNNFPEEFLGKPFAGFYSTYFMIYNDYLVLASSGERIKTWLNDIEEDFIWGRSVEKNDLIEEGLKETSFAMIYSNPWSWNLALSELNPIHQKWWNKNEEVLKQFGFLSIQFTNLDNRYYTEVKFEYQPQEVNSRQQQFSEESLTQFTSRLTNKPKLVKNHNNGKWEIIMQDSAHYISLLNDKGELMWQEMLGERIVSEITQIDYFKNRKLQYIFATDSAIHIQDRNGVALENFPKSYKDFKIKNLSVLDYDRSRNYRLLITDNAGNLRLLNTEGEELEGWNPLAFNSQISDQVFHVRVRGKDRIVIGLENGTIDLRNRRGEEQAGFPLDLEFNLVNPIHFEVGSTFTSSRFTALSEEGLMVEFDLEGKEYARTQLDQSTNATKFALVIDKVKNDMVLARQDLNRLSVLKPDGTTIFEKDFQDNNPKDVQYYNIGVDKHLYIVRDAITGKVYLYNKSGSLINAGNVFSDYPLSVVYHKKDSKCYIYTAVNQTVEVKSFAF